MFNIIEEYLIQLYGLSNDSREDAISRMSNWHLSDTYIRLTCYLSTNGSYLQIMLSYNKGDFL